MAVVILKCECKGTPPSASEYQDKKYGDGMRVCNVGEGDKKVATCTVCGKDHSLK